jgi:hypothetical protein
MISFHRSISLSHTHNTKINEELSSWISAKYALTSNVDFDLAVVGLKIDSEHDDSCCLTIQLLSQQTDDDVDVKVDNSSSSNNSHTQMEKKKKNPNNNISKPQAEEITSLNKLNRLNSFKKLIMRDLENGVIKKEVSKGACPNYIRFGNIPKNFKGSVLTKELSLKWKQMNGQDDV